MFAVASDITSEVTALQNDVEEAYAKIQEYLELIRTLDSSVDGVESGVIEFEAVASADDGWYSEGRYMLQDFKSQMDNQLSGIRAQIDALEASAIDYTDYLESIKELLNLSTRHTEMVVEDVFFIRSKLDVIYSEMLQFYPALLSIDTTLYGVRADLASIKSDLGKAIMLVDEILLTTGRIAGDVSFIAGILVTINSDISIMKYMLEQYLKVEEEFDEGVLESTSEDIGDKQQALEEATPSTSTEGIFDHYRGIQVNIIPVDTIIRVLSKIPSAVYHMIVSCLLVGFIASVIGKSY